MTRKYTKRPLLDRFMEKVDTSGGPDACWPWKNAACKGGYGTFYVDGKYKRSNRVAWELENGPIPEKMHVLHHCDNPPCCNPKCLFIGTDADNIADMYSKDRSNTPGAPGEKNGKAKLTSSQVLEIVERVKNGESVRSVSTHYGLVDSSIHRIISGFRWSHVTGIKKNV